MTKYSKVSIRNLTIKEMQNALRNYCKHSKKKYGIIWEFFPIPQTPNQKKSAF